MLRRAGHGAIGRNAAGSIEGERDRERFGCGTLASCSPGRPCPAKPGRRARSGRPAKSGSMRRRLVRDRGDGAVARPRPGCRHDRVSICGSGPRNRPERSAAERSSKRQGGARGARDTGRCLGMVPRRPDFRPRATYPPWSCPSIPRRLGRGSRRPMAAARVCARKTADACRLTGPGPSPPPRPALPEIPRATGALGNGAPRTLRTLWRDTAQVADRRARSARKRSTYSMS